MIFSAPLSPKQLQFISDYATEDWYDVIICLENHHSMWPVQSDGPWDTDFNTWLSGELGIFTAYLTPNHLVAYLPESVIQEVSDLNEFLSESVRRIRVIRLLPRYDQTDATSTIHVFHTEKTKVLLRQKFAEYRSSVLRKLDEHRKAG